MAINKTTKWRHAEYFEIVLFCCVRLIRDTLFNSLLLSFVSKMNQVFPNNLHILRTCIRMQTYSPVTQCKFMTNKQGKYNGFDSCDRPLFSATPSFVQYFKSNGEFKLELQSGIAQFMSNLHFLSLVTLKFDGWPWKTIGYIFCAMWSLVHNFIS